jgi:hypothetical protein
MIFKNNLLIHFNALFLHTHTHTIYISLSLSLSLYTISAHVLSMTCR